MYSSKKSRLFTSEMVLGKAHNHCAKVLPLVEAVVLKGELTPFALYLSDVSLGP